jgi:VanZ family protein
MLSLWAPVGAFMALLYHLSSRTDLPRMATGTDKWFHAGAYTVLALLCLRAFHAGWGRLALGPTVLALAATMLYGLFDELHQARVPGRVASPLDWLADCGGALLAVVTVLFLTRLRRGME